MIAFTKGKTKYPIIVQNNILSNSQNVDQTTDEKTISFVIIRINSVISYAQSLTGNFHIKNKLDNRIYWWYDSGNNEHYLNMTSNLNNQANSKFITPFVQIILQDTIFRMIILIMVQII